MPPKKIIESNIYFGVASFNNEEAAVWFADIFEDFLEIPSDKRGVNK